MPFHYSRECPVSELHPQLEKLIQPFLSNADEVLTCFEYGFKPLGLWRQPGFASVITHTRLVCANRITLTEGKGAKACQLVDIVHVDELMSPIVFNYAGWTHDHYEVVAHSLGSELHCHFYSQLEAQKFAQILRTAIERAKATAPPIMPQSAISPEERLRRITQLHKDGLISTEEFQQKRREILGEL